MNKCLVRILSFVFCVAMLVGVLPAAHAETLVGRNNPQLMAMRYDENGEIYFTEAAELVALTQQVKNFPDVFFSCTYEGSSLLELTGSFTIPENMAVYCYGGSGNQVRIAPDVTVTVAGFLGAGTLDVQGKLAVASTGGCAASKALKITGTVQMDGYMNLLGGLGTEVTGADKITFGAGGGLWVNCQYNGEEQLRQQIAAAEKAPANWYYDCYNTGSSLHLAKALTIPENLFLSIRLAGQSGSFTLSGSAITVMGEMDVYSPAVIKNDLIIEQTGYLYADKAAANGNLVLEGEIFCEGSMDLMHKTVMKEDLFLGPNGWMHVTAPLTMEAAVTNRGVIDFYYGSGVTMKFSQPDQYDDGSGEDTGIIYVNGSDAALPANVLAGVKLSDFKVKYVPAGGLETPYWKLTNYGEGGNEPQPPQSSTKDVVAMYRLYNPNSGEHFYTGSNEEKNTLVSAGWHYEGIAWNAPIKSGAPVYRLFNPNNGDHHYTMSETERDMLVSVGWKYEGVAWNSASSSNIPMYRLYNPNADCGSHHYTGSTEERDYLVSLGWKYEGIGWYGIA